MKLKLTPHYLVCLLAVAGALTIVQPAAAQSKPAAAPSKDEQKRQKELQQAIQREARPVVVAVNELQKTQGPGATAVVNPKENDPAKAIVPSSPGVDPAAVGWRIDLMKAAEGRVYVPYTITLPADAVPAGPVSVYVRVVEKGAVLSAEEKENKEVKYPFEDFYSLELRAAPGTPARITRAFAAPPGEYDVYVGMRPRLVDNKKRDEPVRVVTFKKAAALPDYWNGDLTTSTVVLTAKVDTIEGQVSPEEQRERPYLFGNTEFIPSSDNKFKKADELSVVFQIYNPTLEAGKPNVTIEYSFHRKLPEGEKYFNKTNPQQMNAETIPPTLDVAATLMLPGGQSVPLASFEPGDYRMEIKITDATSKKTITRDINFTVVA